MSFDPSTFTACLVVILLMGVLYLTRPRKQINETHSDRCRNNFDALMRVIRKADHETIGFFFIAIKNFSSDFKGKVPEQQHKYVMGELWSAWYSRRAELTKEEKLILNV
jgi:hypothetical protein